MKRWIAAALCIGLILSQTGCGQPEQQETNPSTTAETSPTETQASTTPSPEPGTVPESEEVTSPSEMIETLPAEETTPVSQTDSLVAVTLAPVLEEEKDADGASIFQYQYQNITLTIPDAPEAAQKMNEAMAQQIKEAADSAAEIRQWAKQAYTGEGESWTPYTSQIIFTPVRLDSAVVSFSGVSWEYTGGIHPNRVLFSVNFHAETGDALALADVLNHTDMAEALYLKVMDRLEQFANDLDSDMTMFQDGYEETVKEHFNLDSSSSACWYFADSGMHFYFSPYEIAPYSVGDIDIEIPYEELQGVLKEAYFPQAAPVYGDSFSISAAEEGQIDEAQFAQTLSVELDENGTKVAIFSGSAIFDIRVEQGRWDDNGQPMAASQVVFAANRLTAQDLILISSNISGEQPNLRLTLQSEAAESRSYFIRQNDENGSISLTEAAS